MYVNFAFRLVMRAFVMMAMIPYIYVYLFIHCFLEISTAHISLDLSGLSLRPNWHMENMRGWVATSLRCLNHRSVRLLEGYEICGVHPCGGKHWSASAWMRLHWSHHIGIVCSFAKRVGVWRMGFESKPNCGLHTLPIMTLDDYRRRCAQPRVARDWGLQFFNPRARPHSYPNPALTLQSGLGGRGDV